MISLLLALALGIGDPSMTPRPTGVGASYHPPAASGAVRRGAAIGTMRCRREDSRRFGVHLELFANRSVVIVPAGIGVARPFVDRFGTVVPRACTYAVRTVSPTGVIEVRARSRLTLGAFFDVWGRTLGRHRIADFASRRPVLAFVGGHRWLGNPRAIPLSRHAQIVLEIGGFVPPHPRFLFPKGL